MYFMRVVENNWKMNIQVCFLQSKKFNEIPVYLFYVARYVWLIMLFYIGLF